MPLDKESLKSSIAAAFDSVSDKDIEPAKARQQIAEKIAAAIDAYIRAADVTTAGSATAQKGKIT